MDYTYLALRGEHPVVAKHRKYEFIYYLRNISREDAEALSLWRMGGRQGPIRISLESLGL